jgi:murein DD-endopeptidase MepM/ murein hydrolase activator NlpD
LKMNKLFPRFIWIILLVSLLSPFHPVQAQAEAPYPIYIIQKGDTLTTIAQKFSVPAALLIKVNNLPNPDSLTIGSKLYIPGLEGIKGILQTSAVPVGSSLQDLALKYQLPLDQLIRINRITSPAEVFTGSNLVIPVVETSLSYYPIGGLENGQSLLEKAVQQNANPWTLALLNGASNSSQVLPGKTLFLSTTEKDSVKGSLSPLIKSIEISPLPLVQGNTITIHIKTTAPLDLQGSLANHDLHFFHLAPNDYVAMQGIYALASPGLAAFSLIAKGGSNQVYQLEDSLLLREGIYAKDPPLTVDPKTIDPANTKPEDDQIAAATRPATPDRYWTKKFSQPVDEPSCIKSWYGNRRSYNGGPFSYFHTGVDYGVCANLNIRAPAPGVVVFAGPLTVRGNAVVIDHGWGIYSGFWHQSSIQVKVGDKVETGQIIGQIGGTGRVTGPHLHWEIWVNGVQVEPLDWLENVYPLVR